MPQEETVSVRVHKCQEIFMEGFRFKVEPDLYWEHLTGGWEQDTKAFYKKYTYPDKCILDIGAWIGPTVFIGYANNAGHVYAVEADPRNFHTLKLNCRHNYMQDRTTLINRCIYVESGKTMHFGASLEADCSSCRTFSDESGLRVLTSTVPDLIRDYAIDPHELSIVKIDIEGSESFMMNDLEYLSEFKNLCINLSMHPKFWSNKTAILADLGKMFKFYNVYDSKEKPLDLDSHMKMALTTPVYELVLKPR